MRIGEAMKFIDKQISGLERDIFVFDSVTLPRVEKDRGILQSLRMQRVKIAALQEKMQRIDAMRRRGEQIAKEDEVSAEEIMDVLPEAFR